LATLVGLFPGTAAVVILGDALTGNISPALIMVSLSTAALGVTGLVYEMRLHHRERAHLQPDTAQPVDIPRTFTEP